MSKPETKPDNVVPFPSGWDAPGWAEAAKQYREARGDRASIVELPRSTIERVRRYLDPKMSIEAVYRHMNSFEVQGLAQSTIDAAEYLLKQNDPERLRQWLAKHTADERAAIIAHLEKHK